MPIGCFVLCVVVVVCVFSPQKLDERSVVSKKKGKNITHVRVVSRDVVKTVTGRRKKMQKNTQPKERAFLFCVNTTTTVHLYVRFGFRGTRRRKKSRLFIYSNAKVYTRRAPR